MEQPVSIVEEIRRNREKGAARLVSEYRNRLYAAAFSLCGNAAQSEDLVFRTFEQTVAKIDTYREDDSFYRWMYTILLNYYRKSVRGRLAKNLVPMGGLDELELIAGQTGVESVVDKVDGDIVRDAIAILPSKLKEMVILRYFMEMPICQIARFLRIPVGTVSSRLYMARTVLAARLGTKLKKSAVALVAAGLFLLASAVGIGLHSTDAPIGADGSAQDASSNGVMEDMPEKMENASISVPAPCDDDSNFVQLQQENTAMTNPAMKTTVIGGIVRRVMRGISTIAMTALAANASYGDDPYVEGDGTSGISTGYRMKGSSRLEVDFAMVDVSDTSTWNECRIFGTDNSTYEPTLQTCLYATYTASNGNKFFRVRTKTSASSSQPTKYSYGVDTGRHKVVFDLPNAKMIFMTCSDVTGIVTNSYYYSDGGTDRTVDSGVSFDGQESTMPLSLFARWSNAQATAFANGARVRIYGVKIFEDGVPVRDFVPCLKDGVACFKDLVNGGFIVGENAASFTAGGDAPRYVDDGYVSTVANDGSTGGRLYFDSGYKVSKTTAVALDCALAANYADGRLWHLFDDGSSPRFGFNYNAAAGLRYNAFGATSYAQDFKAAFPKPVTGRDVRRTFFIDNANGLAAVVTSGFTNQTATFTTSSASQNATTMKLATDYSASASGNNWTPLKIYGCKIWEDGALKRDFVPYVNNGTPGLRDSLTGAFIAASRESGDTTSSLAYGGAIVEDAYLESAGTTGLGTGYKMKGTSRLEVDFSLPAGDGDPSVWTQWRVFGTDTTDSVEPNLQTCLYLTYNEGNGNKFFVFRTKTAASSADVRYKTGVDADRHLAIMDLPNKKIVFMTGATTNYQPTTAIDYSNAEASLPLSLFARYSNAEGTAFDHFAKARIYSIRIYESDVLKHEFLPYSRGGVAGLYDTVTGEVKSNGSSFTFGGAGQDYGQLKTYIKPGYGDRIGYGESTALTAYAPGATSYRWLCDGNPIDGGTDGVLNAMWMRGGVAEATGFKVHFYQAVAVFEDSSGVTRESAPSAVAAIKCRQIGTRFIIR